MVSDNEEQLINEVWSGSIPISITLSIHDITALEPPPQYFAILPRVSYLPLILDKVIEHFAPFTHTSISTSTMWFSYNGNPLKWQYPIGVLCDLLSGNNPILPWPLEFNFDRYPTDMLLPYQGLKSIRALYQNSLKESTSLLLGTSTPIMNLARSDEEILWKCAIEGSPKRYREIGSGFVGIDFSEIRYLPVKFLYPKVLGGFVVQPIRPMKENSEPWRLGEIASQMFNGFDGKLIAQGIEIPQETPIYWLWKYLSHADNFLYIILID